MKFVIKSLWRGPRSSRKMFMPGAVSILTWYYIRCLPMSRLLLSGFHRMFECPWNFPCGPFTPGGNMSATNRLCVAERQSEEENARLERGGRTCHPVFTVTLLLRNNIYIISCWTATKSMPMDLKEASS